MSSSDFTFISLRNITAYQPTGSWVPENYVLHMSTNGAAAWTNSIILETIQASSIIGDAVVATNIVANDNIIGMNITGSTITGDTITGDTITGDTIIGTDITGTNIVCSTMVGEALIGSTITALSTFSVGSSFFTTPTNYTNTGISTTSSMLIVIGQSLWKIPVEFVSALE